MPRQTVLTRPVDRKRLAALLKREARRRLRERLQAVWWLSEGGPAVEVAAKLGRCRQTVAAFVERYNVHGLQGMRQVGHGPGRRATLQPHRQRTLARWLRQGPRACGYGVNLWSGKWLAHHVAKQWRLPLSGGVDPSTSPPARGAAPPAEASAPRDPGLAPTGKNDSSDSS